MRIRHLIGHLIAVFSLFVASEAFAINAPNEVAVYTLRDCGISSLSGSSQSIAVANPNRKYLGIFNTGNANIFVNVAGGTAAITGISSITVPSGSSLVMLGTAGLPRNAVTVIGTAAQPVSCFEGN